MLEKDINVQYIYIQDVVLLDNSSVYITVQYITSSDGVPHKLVYKPHFNYIVSTINHS